MKNQKMFFTIGGIVIELVGIIFVAISIGSDVSPMIGIFILIIGTGVLVTGVRTKSQHDEPQ